MLEDSLATVRLSAGILEGLVAEWGMSLGLVYSGAVELGLGCVREGLSLV